MNTITAHRTASIVTADRLQAGDIISWSGTRPWPDLTITDVIARPNGRFLVVYDLHHPVTVEASTTFQVWR